MIVEDKIQTRFKALTNNNPLLNRNILKEELQNFVLNFVYNSKYKNLIFTGGTCLRKSYGLNRLSEDLDFDYTGDFRVESFCKDIEEYFVKKLRYNEFSTKIAGNTKTVFLKFPILKQLDVKSKKGTPEDLFLRCDFSKEVTREYKTEVNLIKSGDYEFLALSYDIETLFANKLVAFLQRVFYKGNYQKIPFKGRDVYDLYWFFQLSQKSSFNLKPNKKRLVKLVGIKDYVNIKTDIKNKMKLVDEKFVYDDLYPLLESNEILEKFKRKTLRTKYCLK